MANWRKSRYPGVYVAHSTSCPAFSDPEARCRCKPSWRGRRWDAAAHKPVWGKTTKDRGEVLVWLAAAQRGADHLASLADRGPTFGSLGDEWLDGVERGRIGRRRGKGRPYSDTTIDSMRRRWQCKVRPEFGDRFAGELTEMDWQRWIDQLARNGLSRSSIAQLVSLASGIYAWAAAPSRRLVPRNPLRLVELPPNDEKPRMRVALAPEAAARLAALAPEDRLPYAIAFYAGLRRSELYRLEWPDVLDGDHIATRIHVTKSKSDAGTHRRPPIADNLRSILAEAWERQGCPLEGKLVDRSVMSGKIAARAEAAWTAAGLNRITLHECRHTYASLLMAAGYTIKELMEFMGHADLQMVNRYVKLLPQPGEDDAAERLNAYLERSLDTARVARAPRPKPEA
jgi:integrase